MKKISKTLRDAFKIGFIYFMVSILWILWSDSAFSNWENETSLQTLKGSIFVALSSLVIFLLVYHDLAKRQTIYNQLLLTKRRLNEAQKLGKIGNWELDINTKMIIASEEAYRIFGLTPGIFESSLIHKLLHPDDLHDYKRITNQWIHNKCMQTIHYRIIVDDTMRYIEESPDVNLDSEGKVLRIFGTVRDRTEEVLRQKEINKNLERYRYLFNTSNVGNIITNFKGDFLELNKTVCDLLEYDEQEIKKKNILDIYRKKEDRIVLLKTLKSQGEIKNYEIAFKSKSNKTVWCILNSKIIENEKENLIHSSALDITESKELQFRLSESQKHYRLLADNMIDVISLISNNGEYEYVSPSVEKMTGFKPEEIKNMNVEERIFPDDSTKIKDVHANKKNTGEITSCDFRFKTKEGTYIWLNHRSMTIKDHDDKVKTINITRDISAQKSYQTELEKSEQQYRERLKSLIHRLFAAEEQEKRELAVALHDHFSQLLALSKMKLSEFTNKHKDLADDRFIVDSKRYIDEALSKARTITYELSPPILYELGLIKAINWHIEHIREKHEIKFRFFNNIDQIDLNQEIQIIIYRIFAELIMNIVKHAKAKKVLVIIEQVNDIFYLRISDDGVGFNPELENNKDQGFGLFSIKERVEQMNGIFHIVSMKNKGTVVDISIPTK